MPNKKKQPRNSYYYFMMDLRDDLQAKEGRTFSMKDLADIAAPQWRVLNEAGKRHYEKLAQDFKTSQGQVGGKMDTYGNLIQETQRQEQDVRDMEVKMVKDIESYVCEELGDIDAIRRESFFFMSSKYFCKTDEGYYVPAEIALVHYTIGEGLLQYFHRFIDPGKIPLGYASACKDTSETLLYIPYSKFELADSNYDGIIRGIEDLLSINGLQYGYPIIFCFPEEIEHTQAILDNLQSARRTTPPISFQLYDVSMLFSSLMRFAKSVMTELTARDILNTHLYTYQERTCCDFHWEEDHPEHCALGWAKRICYVFSNYLCDLYEVDVIPGRHLPTNSNSGHTVVETHPPRRTASAQAATRSSPATAANQPPSAAASRSEACGETGIIRKSKSKYDTSEYKHYEPSLSTSLSEKLSLGGHQSDRKLPTQSQSRPKSFAEALCKGNSASAGFSMEDELEFSSLGNPRSSTGMSGVTSDVSLGLSSASSVSSYNFRSNYPDSNTPVGRGIGRGRAQGFAPSKQPEPAQRPGRRE